MRKILLYTCLCIFSVTMLFSCHSSKSTTKKGKPKGAQNERIVGATNTATDISITLTVNSGALNTINVTIDNNAVVVRPGVIRVPCTPGPHTLGWNIIGTPGAAFVIGLSSTPAVNLKLSLDANGNSKGTQPFSN